MIILHFYLIRQKLEHSEISLKESQQILFFQNVYTNIIIFFLLFTTIVPFGMYNCGPGLRLAGSRIDIQKTDPCRAPNTGIRPFGKKPYPKTSSKKNSHPVPNCGMTRFELFQKPDPETRSKKNLDPVPTRGMTGSELFQKPDPAGSVTLLNRSRSLL